VRKKCHILFEWPLRHKLKRSKSFHILETDFILIEIIADVIYKLILTSEHYDDGIMILTP
jgi:hypothetical protein